MNQHFNASLDNSNKHRNQIIYLRRFLWSQRFDDGVRQFNDGDIGEAAKSFSDAVKIQPELMSSRVQMSVSQMLSAEDHQEALAYIDPVPKDSLTSITLNNIALYHFEKQNYPRVIEYAETVLERDPEDLTALIRLAPSLVMVGKLEEAQTAYAALRSMITPNLQLFQDSGRVDYELGQYKSAMQHFRSAIAHADAEEGVPYEPYLYLGLSAYEREEYETMAACFETLAEAYPEDLTVRKNLVKDLESEAEARENLERLERSDAGGF
jgi:tetratricopeptide (TPR) repeat protein